MFTRTPLRPAASASPLTFSRVSGKALAAGAERLWMRFDVRAGILTRRLDSGDSHAEQSRD